jgi:hypothetical protein
MPYDPKASGCLEGRIVSGEPWFRARERDEGAGYSVVHWKGVVLAAIFVLVATAALVIPGLLFGLNPWALGTGGALMLAAILVFLRVLKAKTVEWRG